MGRKALFFDIDGTLVSNPEKKIPDGLAPALARARERGHLLFINTGRTYCASRVLAQELGIPGLCCGGGAHIVLDGETLLHHPLPLEKANRLKRRALHYGIDIILEAAYAIYCCGDPFVYTKGWEEAVRLLYKDCDVHYFALGDESYTFDKFCMVRNPADPEPYEAFLRELSEDFECIYRGGDLHECNQKGYSKGTCIAFVLDRFGIAYEDAFVFGDSANDIRMFQSPAANRIVMKTHDQELEPYATWYAEDVLDDGIAKALEHFHII